MSHSIVRAVFYGAVPLLLLGSPALAADAPSVDVPTDPGESPAAAPVSEHTETTSADETVPSEVPHPDQENGPTETPPTEPIDASVADSKAAVSRQLDEDENAAREAFQRGDSLFLEGDYLGAVTAFEEAYALSGRIEMLFNLANAHDRLGNYSEAGVALRGYIPHAPKSQRAKLERRLQRFERLAKEQRERIENTPQPAAVAPQAPPPAVEPFPIDRVAGVGLITLGGASVIAGIGFAVSANGARKKLDEQCHEGAKGRLCPAKSEVYLDRDKAHSLVADLAFVGGAALAVAGTYLVIRSTRTGEEVGAGIGVNSLCLKGTF